MTNFPIRTLRVVEKLSDMVKKMPWLNSLVLKMNERHNQMMGYRKYELSFVKRNRIIQGLLRDDVISEDSDIVQDALKRLSDKELFDRNFRLRRAAQLNMLHDYLPAEEQTKAEEDKPYLWPHILQVRAEYEQRQAYDNYQPDTTSPKK